MDSTLQAVIIGAVAGQLAPLITYVLNIKKDEKEWQRKQEAEKKKAYDEEQKEEKAHVMENQRRLQEAYQNSISNLWLIVTLEEKEVLSPDKDNLLRGFLCVGLLTWSA